MSGVDVLARWGGIGLVGGFFGVVAWCILVGRIELSELLYGDTRTETRTLTEFSPARLQLLAMSTVTAVVCAYQMVRAPTAIVELPGSLVAIQAVSHTAYLAAKAHSLFVRRSGG